MIADVLSSQAEVIRGRALGYALSFSSAACSLPLIQCGVLMPLLLRRVNFKKFEKAKALPNYDHLMNSSVYKMIHRMEVEPKKGIPARPPKVLAAEDIIERVVSAASLEFSDKRPGNPSEETRV